METYQRFARAFSPGGLAVSDRTSSTVLAAVSTTLLITALSACWLLQKPALRRLLTSTSSPPSLWDPIPCVYNTAQFVFNNTRFTVRVRNILRHSQLHIAKFHLFRTPVFLIAGERNIRTVFASSGSHKIGNESIFVQNVFPWLYRMPKEDVTKFADDKSGRSSRAVPRVARVTSTAGTGTASEEKHVERPRYWAGYAQVHSDYLSRTQHLLPIAQHYCETLSRALDDMFAAPAPPTQTQTTWTMSVKDFCKHQVCGAAISAMFGPRILELNPGLVDAFWDFDDNIFVLTLGFPRWIAPGAHRAQDRFFDMVSKHLRAGDSEQDQSDLSSSQAASSSGPDWEPNLGARVVREVAGWFRRNGFRRDVSTGALAMLIMGLNSNTIPTTMWVIMEVLTDPWLFQEIRQEVATAYYTTNTNGEPKTGSGARLDLEKLVTLPLLQSVVAEVLRVRVSFNLMRNVNEPIPMPGGEDDSGGGGGGDGRFTLPKGAMLQVPTDIAHYDEAIWGTAEHPPTEFWAERHIRYKNEDNNGAVESSNSPIPNGRKKQKRVFSMAGRPSSYFPFGGGLEICPGRHYAKYQIFVTIALIVSKFDVEVLGWTELNGSASSTQPAKAHPRYSGTGVVHPDRDLRVRLRRVDG